MTLFVVKVVALVAEVAC